MWTRERILDVAGENTHHPDSDDLPPPFYSPLRELSPDTGWREQAPSRRSDDLPARYQHNPVV